MKNKKYFLTSGEFAKMNGINKRTLHYYNDIGLFRPEMIDGKTDITITAASMRCSWK